MRKTSNLDLRLYDASDKFDITNTSNSLNSNMEIIDRQVNNLNNNIKGIDELKKETASLKRALVKQFSIKFSVMIELKVLRIYYKYIFLQTKNLLFFRIKLNIHKKYLLQGGISYERKNNK